MIAALALANMWLNDNRPAPGGHPGIDHHQRTRQGARPLTTSQAAPFTETSPTRAAPINFAEITSLAPSASPLACRRRWQSRQIQAGPSGTDVARAGLRPSQTGRFPSLWQTWQTPARGSLRAAISAADAISPGRSAVIGFAVAGTIRLASGLPAISRQVTIDARTARTRAGSGRQAVEIDCNGHAGLRLAPGSAGSRLLGVAVNNAGGNGVTLNAGAITLDGDYVGLDLSGAAFGNHGAGVCVSASSSRNLIGLNGARSPGVVANVTSGNTGSGLVLARFGPQHRGVQSHRDERGWHQGDRQRRGRHMDHRQINTQPDRRHRLRQHRHRPGEQPDREQGHGTAGLRGAARWAT